MSETAYGNDAVQRCQWQLWQCALEESLTPVERGDVFQGIDDDGRAEEMQWEVVSRVGSGGGECDGGEERANEKEVDAHRVWCLGVRVETATCPCQYLPYIGGWRRRW